MASQTSATADDISKAIEDISNGAVSQADEIEKASQDIDEMGRMIKNIVDNVAELDAGTREVKESSDESIQIIGDLSDSNDRSMEAMRQISQKVHATNESAMKIRAAIDLITSIAEETNLLSLNASIEAARAGEQGKGFAVVASQIQKLAEQSNESAGNIAVIIGELIEDSENSVQVMDEVQVVMNEQQQKLQQTKNQFKQVGDGISAATEAAGLIRHQTEECDNARANVVDVITNLSAISQQNAASTQETTASMEELNATMNILAESASSLQEVSKSLEDNIAFFRDENSPKLA
jgi:methyl-accepting chemotaxis protein